MKKPAFKRYFFVNRPIITFILFETFVKAEVSERQNQFGKWLNQSKTLNVFHKHMKFRIQARLCLAIYEFEAHIMLSLCLTFQGTGLPV